MIHYQLSLLNLESEILRNWIGNINAKPLLCDMDIQHGRNISKVERRRRKRKRGGKQRTDCFHFHSFPRVLQTEILLLSTSQLLIILRQRLQVSSAESEDS